MIVTLDQLKTSLQAVKDYISKIMPTLMSGIADEFDASNSYEAGDYVMSGGKLYKFTTAHETGAFDGTDAVEVVLSDEMVNDVTVNGTSVVSNGVAEIPMADTSNFGVIKGNSAGGITTVNGALEIVKATNADIKSGSNNYRAIVSNNQHQSTFYGLAKAAGDTTQSSSANAVGTYTDEAKTAIKAMLGVADKAEMISDVISSSEVSGIKSMIAPEYDPSLTYNENDYVIYNNQLYKANQAIETAEAWNSAHWMVTSTTSEIQDLQRNISYPTAIAVTQGPTQTQYEIGNSFDKTGMVVTLIWSTGETRVLADNEYTVSPVMFNTTGTQNVTITYRGTEPYVLTATQEVSVVNIIPDTWEKMVQVSRTGVARDFFQVGDTINDTYTIGTTEYTNPWIVADFQTVELEDGTIYNDVPILVMQHTNHENVMFDAPEQTEATEETASAGHYYYGYTAEGTVYTALNLSVGDTIPYEEYDKVFVTLWNSVNAIRYGTNSWKYSYARQYLNNSGTGWWQPTHECDVMPSGYESRVGFQSYISNDLVSAIHPIKITTKESNYMGGGVDTTYDKFWLPSLSEMNISNNNIATVDGEPWEYYKELLESEEKVSSSTYAVLKRYAVNATTSAQQHWVRSAVLGGISEWIVYSSGQTYYSYPNNQFRLAPACAII